MLLGEDEGAAPADDKGSPPPSPGGASERDRGAAAGDLSRSETRLVMKLSLVGMKDLGASWVAGGGVERVSAGAVVEASGGSRVAAVSVVWVGWSTGPTSDSESVQLNTEPWEASVRHPPKSSL